MKAAPVVLPAFLHERLGASTPLQFMAVGNTALLAQPLLGLIASRACPGHVLLQTLELTTQWARVQQVVLSGFHSPLAQQVLRSVLRSPQNWGQSTSGVALSTGFNSRFAGHTPTPNLLPPCLCFGAGKTQAV